MDVSNVKNEVAVVNAPAQVNAAQSHAQANAAQSHAPEVAIAESQPVVRETQTNTRSVEELDRAISQINKSISNFHRHMEISVHKDTKRIMVKVMDTDKNEVIRELPPEKALDAFARALELAGVFVDQRR